MRFRGVKETETKFTDQQEDICNTKENQIISALAGTGKTTTIIEHSRRHVGKKLMCAFNKSMSDEIAKKIYHKGIKNVDVMTIHSLAYRHTNAGSILNLKDSAHPMEMLELLRKKTGNKKLNEFIAYLSSDLLNYYCTSDKEFIHECADDFSAARHDVIHSELQKALVAKCAEILKEAMIKREIGATHDLYLKLFQLSKPSLGYDYIYVDEFQDTNPVVIDIIKSNADKSIITLIGDDFQSIYGYRGAINAMNLFSFNRKYLTKSFRFSHRIAKEANDIIRLKTLLKKYDENFTYDRNLEIEGSNANEIKSNNLVGVISRTNAMLIDEAIRFVQLNTNIPFIFEGGFSGYINKGTINIYDVLYLMTRKKEKIQAKFIRDFNSFQELCNFGKDNSDKEIISATNLCNKYGTELFQHFRTIKERECQNKDYASVVFATGHKSKGQEYGRTFILDGFAVSSDVIIDNIENKKELSGMKKLINEANQEINLAYVGVTRSMLNFKYISKEERGLWVDQIMSVR